jgi:hypothetical protein
MFDGSGDRVSLRRVGDWEAARWEAARYGRGVLGFELADFPADIIRIVIRVSHYSSPRP